MSSNYFLLHGHFNPFPATEVYICHHLRDLNDPRCIYIRPEIKDLYHCSVVRKIERNSIMVVTKHSPLIYITADWFTGGSVPKMLQCTSSQNKMASYRSYTSEEVLAEIFANPDLDFDGESSSDESYTEEVLSESTESSESDESDELSKNDAQESTPRPAGARGRGWARQHNGAPGRGARRNQQVTISVSMTFIYP